VVKQCRVLGLFVFSMAVYLMLFQAAKPLAKASSSVAYSVSQEWAQIQINTDRSIYLLYNISYTYLSGSPQGIFRVGMPKGGFQVHYVQDLSGTSLDYQDVSSGSYYGIDVYVSHQSIVLNEPYTFIVYALVPNMIYDDTSNTGNVGMQFYPTTLSGVTGSVTDLRVETILPPGVKTTDVKYPSGNPFDNVFTETNNDTAVFWNRANWPPSQQFNTGVSFPASYVSAAPTPSPSFPDFTVPTKVFIVFVSVVLVLAIHRIRNVKLDYLSPRLSIEALGANRTLTAVEAAVVLEVKPIRVLAMILYGLLFKRMVQVTETEPLIKLEKLVSDQGESAPKPRYYESAYMKAVTADGTLGEQQLAQTYIEVADEVDKKLRGYSREDTANYYESIVEKAWTQVTQAGTPQLKGDAVDANLQWLLTDSKFEDRFRSAFPPGILVYPNPGWWWYYGGLHGPVGQAKPQAAAATATLSAQAVPIPGQDFANTIVRGVQAASNNIVKDLQTFANSLVPYRPPPSQHPVAGHPSCVCACHACACACACVSCACACAGGGGR
jgi:hypothetical protein